MMVTNEQAKKDMRYPYEEYPTNKDIKIALYAADLLEARTVIEKQTTLINEMQKDLLKISQYSIACVCEEARIIAREATKVTPHITKVTPHIWKKSMEVTE